MFQAISQKKSIFRNKFAKNFDFFRVILYKMPIFTANFRKISIFQAKIGYLQLFLWQIILFLFKSHHFRTYFLYMIRYNNISRPVHDPTNPLRPTLRPSTTPLPKIWGSRPPTPRIDAYVYSCQANVAQTCRIYWEWGKTKLLGEMGS